MIYNIYMHIRSTSYIFFRNQIYAIAYFFLNLSAATIYFKFVYILTRTNMILYISFITYAYFYVRTYIIKTLRYVLKLYFPFSLLALLFVISSYIFAINYIPTSFLAFLSKICIYLNGFKRL